MTIGIDPGITGAIARISQSGAYEVHDIPIMANGKGKAKVKNWINAAAFHELLGTFYEHEIVFVERMTAMPGQSSQTAMSVGDSLGVIRGVCAAQGKSIEIITPQSWKKYYNLGKDKEICRAKAIELFPNASLSRKKDHNRAEALLIAKYGVDKK